MSRGAAVRRWALVGAAGLLLTTEAVPQAAPQRPAPKLEAVAETALICDGLNRANFDGLGRLLAQRPKEAEAWTFARGQALLIAETGNLLMLRPPRNQGQAEWMDRATQLRTAGTRLARLAADRDFDRGRAALVELGDACNRCHQTFRVPVRVTPFEDAGRRTD